MRGSCTADSIVFVNRNCVYLEGNMTADNENDIKEAFQRAQKGHNNKAKLVASLKSRYNKVRSALESQLYWFSYISRPIRFYVLIDYLTRFLFSKVKHLK